MKSGIFFFSADRPGKLKKSINSKILFNNLYPNKKTSEIRK